MRPLDVCFFFLFAPSFPLLSNRVRELYHDLWTRLDSFPDLVQHQRDKG